MFRIRQTALLSLAGVAFTFALPGCETGRPDIIPSSAQMAQSGTGMTHYTAPADGTVYVYDKTTQRLIWSGKVLRGQAVDLDTVKNRIMADGRVVATRLLNANSENDIYFDAAPLPPPAPAPQATGVIVSPNATVQQSSGANGAVTVQPGLTVSPATQPAQQP